MSTFAIEEAPASQVVARADRLFLRMRIESFRRTDYLFAGLLVLEWLAAIAMALLVSPLTWAGEQSQTHFHVWLALLFGAAIISFPVALTLARPGQVITSHL